MTNGPPHEFNDKGHREPGFGSLKQQSTNLSDLSNNPKFKELLALYQQAEFAKCSEILEDLEKHYPHDPALLKFKEDFELKLSMRKMDASIKKDEKRLKRKNFFNLSIFTVISILVVLVAFYFSLQYFIDNQIGIGEVQEQATTDLSSLYYQADQLLLIGQPQQAAEIVEQIRSIEPDSAGLPDLIARTENMLQLEAQYQSALDLLAATNKEAALELFQAIDAEKSGLWDIRQRIQAIETAIQIEESLAEGEAAYQAENWAQVIMAYENALKLDSEISDPQMREQLLNAYLNQIINMLEDESATIEEIEKAEGYYRKAAALIPQSREFTRERINLQELTSDLLVLKFTQIGKENLADQSQTASTIASAVSYLRRAANINPKNAALLSDLKNAEIYQVAFRNFINMNWGQAITELTQIYTADAGFADGNASNLLYEAYYAVGKQYFTAGLYQDALRNLEQAELLAWDDKDNLAKLFQVQIRIGDTFGKMEDYENAISYYQYALNVIKAHSKVSGSPVISAKLNDADVLVVYENYEAAYEAYQEFLDVISVVYTIREVEISDGASLALFANEHSSTLDDVLKANNLSNTMVITFGRTLKVPSIDN